MCEPQHLSALCVQRFLTRMGQPSLMAWLDIEPGAHPATIRRALDARRRWAQAQQANPRHRDQALWTIKHHRKLVEALVDDPRGVLRLEQELRQARRERLLAELALHSMDWAEDKALLADLRQRIGASPIRPEAEELLFDPEEQAAEDEVTQPELDVILDEARLAGLTEAHLRRLVSMQRALGLTDAQIAVLMVDEVSRAGRVVH